LGIFLRPPSGIPGSLNFYNADWQRFSAIRPDAENISGMPVGYMGE
jgi:hypothetical protein